MDGATKSHKIESKSLIIKWPTYIIGQQIDLIRRVSDDHGEQESTPNLMLRKNKHIHLMRGDAYSLHCKKIIFNGDLRYCCHPRH